MIKAKLKKIQALAWVVQCVLQVMLNNGSEII
jgi:hypothetical protein